MLLISTTSVHGLISHEPWTWHDWVGSSLQFVEFILWTLDSARNQIRGVSNQFIRRMNKLSANDQVQMAISVMERIISIYIKLSEEFADVSKKILTFPRRLRLSKRCRRCLSYTSCKYQQENEIKEWNMKTLTALAWNSRTWYILS